jgi:hypothetical protein
MTKSQSSAPLNTRARPSLLEQVTELQRENHVLKDLVKVEMAGDGGADEILAKCQTDFAPVVMSSDNGQATSLLEKQGIHSALLHRKRESKGLEECKD